MDHVPPLTLLIYLLFGMAKDGCIMFLLELGTDQMKVIA
jgi:hypothetical protein